MDTEALRNVLGQAKLIALDAGRSVPDRTGAIGMLAHLPFNEVRDAYSILLKSDQPIEVQRAAIEVLRQIGSEESAQIVLDQWPVLGPELRGSGLQLLMARTSTTKQVLVAMAEGTIPASIVDVDRRVRLLRSGDKSIRKLAEKLFGGAISANRQEVAKTYENAVSPAFVKLASAEAGATVFQKTCIKCHKHDGKGADVGPDISDVRNRSREALLYDILDPNRKVEPRFMDYSVVTTDGRTFNGLMISETAEAVVLRQAEGKQQVIPRNDIEILKASGRSLMPEGVEKDVTVQQMADLLEFLKSRDRPALQSVTSGTP